MKTLSLKTRPTHIQDIVSGHRDCEIREIRPQTSQKYIEYFDKSDTSKVYKTYDDVPDEVEIDARPLKYDALRLIADDGNILVRIKDIKIYIVVEEDKDGNTFALTYHYKGKEYVTTHIHYYLGEIIESNV